jgi:hypothetical protein
MAVMLFSFHPFALCRIKNPETGLPEKSGFTLVQNKYFAYKNSFILLNKEVVLRKAF